MESWTILALLVSCVQSFSTYVRNNGSTGGRLIRDTQTVLTEEQQLAVQQMIDDALQRQIGYGELCYMGMKSRVIPNYAITASSYWGGEWAPHRARLDNQRTHGSRGAWSSKENKVGQYLQVDFGDVKEVAGIITQGRPVEGNQWVRSFTVACGEDWHLVTIQENGRQKVFDANSDRDTKVYNRFPQVLSCRFIRIYPQSWSEHMSMRVEFVPGSCFDDRPPFHTQSRNKHKSGY